MEAIVLAGGLGTRLRGAAGAVPKPMAQIAGRPFLDLLLRHLAASGITKCILSVGYLHQTVTGYFRDHPPPVEVAFAVEHEPLGTGGAVRNALSHLAGDAALVLNGDTFLEVDYHQLEMNLAGHDVVLAIRHADDARRYGTVVQRGAGRVEFLEKGSAGSGCINAGVYMLTRSLFDRFPFPERFSLERGLLQDQAHELAIATVETSGYFIDFGLPEDYARAQRELPARLCSPSV